MKLQMHNKTENFLRGLDAKQMKQIATRVFGLSRDPKPSDYRHLTGYPFHLRIDVGEFRVVYVVDDDTVFVKVIAPCNDDAVYRELARR